MAKIKLKKCDLCCCEYSTYDVFEADSSDCYIIEYEFRFLGDKSTKIYGLMHKNQYLDGGIVLVVNEQTLYSLGKECFITGYCPIDIILKIK